MSEEMQIEGKTYISSKRAAEISGYAQDYIGQLSRKALIDARRIGGLWYVSMESLDAYKKKADEFKPQPPAMRIETQEPSSLIFFDGKEYLSAAKAAEETGYTQDYVGQLARAGTILSRQVGNRWYVERVSLVAHKKEKDGLLAAVQSQAVGLQKSIPVVKSSSEYLSNTRYSGPGPLLNYVKDDSDLIPITNKIAGSVNAEVSPSPIRIKRLYEAPVTRFQDIQTTKRPRILLPERSGGNKTMLPLLLASAATIVIVLSVGYASVLRQNSVYAVGKNPATNAVNALSANASQLFNSVGNILEPLITRELIYDRGTNN